MTQKQLAESYRRIAKRLSRSDYWPTVFLDEADRLDPPLPNPPHRKREWLMARDVLESWEQPPGTPDCVMVREVGCRGDWFFVENQGAGGGNECDAP
jgi:hypothetical protein